MEYHINIIIIKMEHIIWVKEYWLYNMGLKESGHIIWLKGYFPTVLNFSESDMLIDKE